MNVRRLLPQPLGTDPLELAATGMTHPPFVVFGSDWRRHPNSLQHLFLRLMPHNQVLWVNALNHRVPKLTWYDLRRGIAKLRDMALQPAAAPPGYGLGKSPRALVSPRVLPWHNVPLVRKINRVSLTRDIRAALRSEGLTTPPILVFGAPAGSVVLDELEHSASVYFCMDNYAAMPGVSAALLSPLEDRLLARVDAVVATAHELTVLKRPASGRAYHLPQGVNAEHFSRSRPIPAEIAALPRPRLGFAGKIGEQCDIGLLRRVAEAYPQGSLVLVGRVQTDVSELSTLRNVHFIDYQPYDDLPAFVQGFDVGLIPYLLSDWTRSVDSLKQLEYLAAGVPVVTTALPEAFKYQSAMLIAHTEDEFLSHIQRAIDARGPSADERARVAAANSWDSRAARFSDILDEIMTPAVPRERSLTCTLP